jgi:hypothetical protein
VAALPIVQLDFAAHCAFGLLFWDLGFEISDAGIRWFC